ncbi:MAG TPA: oligopeptide transporter, OPT family [Sphingomonas sp.]|jgi:putative OPT family oligopeptide transporter|nr:oligopeptide transporter, OPT family [Sphingomonas sp.]
MTPDRSLPEITVRGVLLGILLTFLFTAANLYLGLKVGLTFATSIPAAVVSMALLRAFKDANILENNIVQTVASAAGTIASIGFVLPGLIMTGWWTGFPFWTSFWVCATGGLFGVLFSVPLRRALVTGSDLPYPEGVAAAEVLKVGSAGGAADAENRAGLHTIVMGTLAAAGYSLVAAMGLAASSITKWFRVGPVGTGLDFGMQLALVGAGHLVGRAVGLAIGFGLIICFGIATPLLTWLQGTPGAAELVWAKQVRFFGAGVIGIAALWTLGRLLGPVLSGLRQSLAASRARSAGEVLAVEEQDLSIRTLALGSVALLVPTAAILWLFAKAGPLAPAALPLTLGGLAYVLVIGAVVAAVCGYMAGLIGSSNSPVSGLGILGIVAAASLLLLVKPWFAPSANAHLVAFAIFATAIVFSVATIANDNLQDLKTGQLVGATPWKQQVALVIGVLAGSAVIPGVLDLLNKAYGFAPLEGTPPADALAAPQAILISSLAKGVLGTGLNWALIGSGALVGAALIVLDIILKRQNRYGCPPLAVGLGIYLPMGATLPVVIGALIGDWFDRAARDEETRRRGVLLASGFIVGDGLFGVALAGLIVATGSGTPLALVGESFATPAIFAGALLFAALVALTYRRTLRRSA